MQLYRDRFRFVLRHLELTTDPDRPELFRKEKRKQVEHFLKSYLKVVLFQLFTFFVSLSQIFFQFLFLRNLTIHILLNYHMYRSMVY